MQKWINTIEYTFDNPIIDQSFTENSIFFDIETTGFSPAYTQLYLIGVAYRKGSTVTIEQYFAENKNDEADILTAFFHTIEHFDTIITFNGIGFDIPYLKAKCEKLQVVECFSEKIYLDIFKIVSNYKFLLNLPNYKQKTVEHFLHIEREDPFNGGELIDIYKEYVSSPNNEQMHFLKQHNYEDVLGMIELLSVLSYSKLFEGHFSIINIESNEYRTMHNTYEKELIFTLKSEYHFPSRVSYRFDDFYLTCNKDEAKLCIHLFDGELKFFYENPKDYYYLPSEDRAIHKSVAGYVDKEFRKNATNATCYSKKESIFLPQMTPMINPSFKKDFKEKLCYFELSEEFISSSDIQYKYIVHILNHMTKNKQ